MKRPRLALSLVAGALLFGGAESRADFTYNGPGQLVAGSGQGRVDENVYVPGMRFPLEAGPAYANSQVWGRGGMNGGGGSQCDTANYSYPWWDNYCETRQWEMPLCPAGSGHQGQDIRPATCEANRHWAVAADNGRVIQISSYILYMIADDGTVYSYMHMDPETLAVQVDQRVTRGQRLGRVSNYFGGTPTTIHLHFEILRYFQDFEWVHLPPYTSLVQSYQVLRGDIEDPGTPEPGTPEPDPTDPGPGEPGPGEAGEPDPGELVPPCDILPPDGIIDDIHPCFLLQGNTETWRRAGSQSAIGQSYYWTYTTNEAVPDGWVKWRINLAQAGRYRVETRVVSPHNNSVQAPYEIRHGGQVQTVRINQFAAPGWRELGVFEFASGQDQWVALYDNTGEPYSERIELMVDAIRVTLVEATPEPTSPDQEPSPEPSPQEPEPTVPGSPSNPQPPASTPDDEDFTIELIDDDMNNGSACSGCRLATNAQHPSPRFWLLGLIGALFLRRRHPHNRP